MKILTDKFWVITDTGDKYIVYEYTSIADSSTFQNPNTTIPVQKELRTFNGMSVNIIEEGIYEIVQLNVIARKIP
ncbi:MAG TPA: hypothetical protein VLG39_11175 [Nitrospirota bacterium]|nr:hypothetical protein [Nitrospirota bacterium]